MTTLTEKIKSELKEGYELVFVDNHKASTYFYIMNPNGIKLVARTSDHDAICAASKSHVQVICDTLLHLDFDFEEIYDEDDYEIELTKKEASKQLTNYFGIEITEEMIWEADEFNCKLNWENMNAETIDLITAIYIAAKIAECEPTVIY